MAVAITSILLFYIFHACVTDCDSYAAMIYFCSSLGRQGLYRDYDLLYVQYNKSQRDIFCNL